MYNNDLNDHTIVINATNLASNVVVERVFAALKGLTDIQRKYAVITDSLGRKYSITRMDEHTMLLFCFYDAVSGPLINTYIMKVINDIGFFLLGNLPSALNEYTGAYGSIITINYFR